jgi:hypothetical protein
MKALPFKFEIGSYQMELPSHAEIEVKVPIPSDDQVQQTSTRWTIRLGRFWIFAHTSVEELDGLKRHIDWTSKSNVLVKDVCINGISGITHGDYVPPRTWIDWWLKKGDLTLCLNLQSVEFPVAFPDQQEKLEHNAIIHSIISLVE